MGVDRGSMDSIQVMNGVPVETMLEALRDAGFATVMGNRVDRTVTVASSLNGVGFWVHLTMHREAPDLAISLQFRGSWTVRDPAEGTIDRVNAYNFRMRFGKACWDEQASEMTLEMDAITAGGITSRYLREVIDCWARVLMDFMKSMRDPSQA
jgi:hypothetical protein